MNIEISSLVNNALDFINHKAEAIRSENACDHHYRMEQLDWQHRMNLERMEVLDSIAPFHSVEEWFDSLSDHKQESWYDLFGYYWFHHFGDSVVESGSLLTCEVMGLLADRHNKNRH